MAHVRQKTALFAIGCFCRHFGLSQCLGLPALGDIAQETAKSGGLPPVVGNEGNG